jgi:hypothetical protein
MKKLFVTLFLSFVLAVTGCGSPPPEFEPGEVTPIPAGGGKSTFPGRWVEIVLSPISSWEPDCLSGGFVLLSSVEAPLILNKLYRDQRCLFRGSALDVREKNGMRMRLIITHTGTPSNSHLYLHFAGEVNPRIAPRLLIPAQGEEDTIVDFVVPEGSIFLQPIVGWAPNEFDYTVPQGDIRYKGIRLFALSRE